MGVEHHLGLSGRAGGEQGHRQIGSSGRGRGDGGSGAQGIPCRLPALGQVDAGQLCGREPVTGEHDVRLDGAQHAVDLGGANQMMHREGDRPQAPAGPKEDVRLQAIRQLPCHGVAPGDPRCPQPSGDTRHELRRRHTVGAMARVDHGGRPSHRVEGGHIPSPAGLAVRGAAGLAVGGPQSHQPGQTGTGARTAAVTAAAAVAVTAAVAVSLLLPLSLPAGRIKLRSSAAGNHRCCHLRPPPRRPSAFSAPDARPPRPEAAHTPRGRSRTRGAGRPRVDRRRC